MANTDPLRVGVTTNLSTSPTRLMQTGSPSGNGDPAFWVWRVGAPGCIAAIRGDEDSIGAGQSGAGVMGTTNGAGTGVIGVSGATTQLFMGDTGVLGDAASYGVVGRARSGLILNQEGLFVSATGVVGECNRGIGVHGVSIDGWGVIGKSATRPGVAGESLGGTGVEARSLIGLGVQADSVSNDGVLGRSRDAAGVRGMTQAGQSGVHGHSDRTAGVWGSSDGAPGVDRRTGPGGVGVVGSCPAGQGVLGGSITGIGVGGYSQTGWAGYFDGDVVVRGSLYVNGAKAAAVEHADGSHRALFCLESPESHFEDFGEATLVDAAVTVKLQKDFSCLIKRNGYQVFLTCYGPETVYVRNRNVDGFEIARVDAAADAKRRKVRVGYRIVARRADLKTERLPRIKIETMAAAPMKPNLPKTRKGGTRADALRPLEALPTVPKTPSVDLRALVKRKPKGKASARSRTASGS